MDLSIKGHSTLPFFFLVAPFVLSLVTITKCNLLLEIGLFVCERVCLVLL